MSSDLFAGAADAPRGRQSAAVFYDAVTEWMRASLEALKSPRLLGWSASRYESGLAPPAA
jgi:hypothetical protein